MTDTDSASDDDLQQASSWDHWVSEEGDTDMFHSLFSQHKFSDPEALLQHDRDNFGFDLREVQKRLGLDFYSLVKVVNYVRLQVRLGVDSKVIVESVLSAERPWSEEKNLMPVLENDRVLYDLPIEWDE